jgi:hypothetical protein
MDKNINIWDYIEEEGHVNYLIKELTPLIIAWDEKSYTSEEDIFDMDLELFLEEFSVAIGLDEIRAVVMDEYERRASYFNAVDYAEAKEFALGYLKDRFFSDSATFFKSDSLYASAFDWLDEKYTLVSIPLEECDSDQYITILFDFSKATFDYKSFTNQDWYWLQCDFAKMIENLTNTL